MSATFMIPSRIVDTMYDKIANGETGGTFSVDGHAVPDTGYFVGGAVPSLINPTREQVLEFVETAGADYVGYWEDSETLALYVDAVDWTPSEAYARRLTELHGEIAYWDAVNAREIRVGV
jgi:hypothetical protein